MRMVNNRRRRTDRRAGKGSGYERTIDSHVENLPRKLGPDGGKIIETVPGGWLPDGAGP